MRRSTIVTRLIAAEISCNIMGMRAIDQSSVKVASDIAEWIMADEIASIERAISELKPEDVENENVELTANELAALNLVGHALSGLIAKEGVQSEEHLKQRQASRALDMAARTTALFLVGEEQ